MKRWLREWGSFFCWTLLILYVFVNSMACLKGFVDADYKQCTEAPRKIEKLFPGHKIGCWLGQRDD